MADVALAVPGHKAVDSELRKIWGLGSNVIIGWRALPFGLDVLYLPSYELPRVAKLYDDILRANRHIESPERFQALVTAGCRAKEIKIDARLGRDDNSVDAINKLIRAYTVSHIPCRAVCLFDMVSFSLYSPFEQITQISLLSHYIKLASMRCQRLNMPMDLCSTTTGDGFYVWNRNEGLMADVALYCTAMLALGYVYAARAVAKTEAVPRLRCGLHWGSHYEYYGGSASDVFIVGEVTIELARIISTAQSGQLLIGSYLRDLTESEPQVVQEFGIYSLDTANFMALAQGQLARLADVPVPGGKIESFNVFLTGPSVSEDTYSIRKYYVTDKHGLEHPCYNARLNMKSSSGEIISFGLLDRDLGKFKARTDANEDIVIRMG